MSLSNKYLYSLIIILILILVFTTACGLSPAAPEQPAGSSEQAAENEGDEEHAMEHEGDGEHEHSEARISNNGAVIRITAPQDGLTIKEGDDLVIEVETENFVLGEDGSHWHIYVDGESHGMIVGGDLDHVLRGLEPGQHEISTYLSIGTHEELEDGASITITVE